MKIFIIEGSTRQNKGTQTLIDHLMKANPHEEWQQLSLQKEPLAPFIDKRVEGEWDFAQPSLPILKKMLAADLIILASPVYWFSVSHLFKNFFDYWTFYMRAGQTPDPYFLSNKKVMTLLSASHKEGSEWVFGSIRQSVHYVKGKVVKEFIGLADRSGNVEAESLQEILSIDLKICN